MNIPQMQPQVPGGIPQVPQQQPGTPQQGQQIQQIPQQTQEKLDNISKVKSLIGPLRESLAITLKTAAQTLHQNSLVDTGSLKGVDVPVPRFDKNMEEFYSLCDQIELHLLLFRQEVHLQSIICNCMYSLKMLLIIESSYDKLWNVNYSHNKTSIECLLQGASSQRYLPLPVATTRMEPLPGQDSTLTYPQYLATVRSQLAYTKEVQDCLLAAAQNLVPGE